MLTVKDIINSMAFGHAATPWHFDELKIGGFTMNNDYASAISFDQLVTGKRYICYDDMVSYTGIYNGESIVIEKAMSLYFTEYKNPSHLIGTELQVTDELTIHLCLYQGELQEA